MAGDATGSTVDPALESLASALRADLAARGVPADELPEPVVLALAAVIERIERLEQRFDSLYELPTLTLPPRAGILQSALDRVRDQIQDGLAEAAQEAGQERAEEISVEEYRRRSDRLRAQAEHARSLRENLTPLGTPLSTMYPPEAPRFRHDCPDCVFLGRSVCGTQDLYYCEVDWMPRHVSVRWGNVDDDDNKERFVTRAGVRGFSVTGDWPDPHLADAYRRAVARGLVGGAGEGEGG
jgi:hypothetical protein